MTLVCTSDRSRRARSKVTVNLFVTHTMPCACTACSVQQACRLYSTTMRQVTSIHLCELLRTAMYPEEFARSCDVCSSMLYVCCATDEHKLIRENTNYVTLAKPVRNDVLQSRRECCCERNCFGRNLLRKHSTFSGYPSFHFDFIQCIY